MDDYPNPDDEFEMLQDMEMEMMREMQQDAPFPEDEPAVVASGVTSLSDLSSSQATAPGAPASQSALLSQGVKRSAPTDELQFLDDDFFMEEEAQQRPQKKRKKPLLPEVRGCDEPLVGRRQALPDPDLAVIERITHLREEKARLVQLQKGTSSTVSNSSGVMINNDAARYLSKCAIHNRIPDGGFQAITSCSGERFYISAVDKDDNEDIVSSNDMLLPDCVNTDSSNGSRREHRQLLSVPYQQLKEKAEAILQQQAVRVARAAEANAAEDSGIESEGEDTDNGALWTDLYRPETYLHLLSDEMTNRTVLYWIKMWDKVVFGIDRKTRPDKNKEQPRKDGNKFSKFYRFNQLLLNELTDEVEADGRPAQKIVLLCGPPGLGKTTLAHIIARHAGYNVVELNASDDRSVDAFRSSIENATSMKSVLHKDKRPNCLIIDEIDGAPAPSIKLLVNFITGKGLGGKAPPKKKSKEKMAVLQRPIIAICNDLYVPALRPLRQVALVVNFPPILPQRLAQRLHDISCQRGLRTDLTALLTLAQKTNNDIRSCLSLLQFVRNKRCALKMSDIDSAAMGQKDYQQSLFAVWHSLFSVIKPTKVKRVNPHELGPPGTIINLPDIQQSDSNTPTVNRYNEVLKTAVSCSEYDRILLGWFENYPTAKFKHTYLEPVTAGLEWASFLDVMQREIHTSQSWMLQRYLGHVFVALHLQFAGHQKHKIVFPTQHNEFITKQQRSEAVLSSLLQQMCPQHRVFVTPRLLSIELLPFLCNILQPNFRPVNTQLYSAKEKAELFTVINTMLAYNLTYSQEKSPEGRYVYVMEPNVEDVVRFPTQDSDGRKGLGYTARQLVAREVEIERVRRAESYFSEQEQQNKINPHRANIFESSGAGSSKGPQEQFAPSTEQEESSSQQKKSNAIPNHLQKLVAKPVTKMPEEKILPRDFFGRVIQVSPSQESANTNKSIIKSDIWFKFKEGYSNAVRRPIKMKELQ